MSRRRDAIWITWERHRRTRSLVDRLGIPLFEYVSRTRRLVRHPAFVLRSVVALVKQRPRVLVIQSPSVVLNLLAILLRPLFGYRLVVDAHNAGVYSCEAGTDRLAWLYPHLHRSQTLTLVSNPELAEIVAQNGGRALVLIDPLPELPTAVAPAAVDPKKVAYICTFAGDEPFNEVIRAAALLPPGVTVHITGNVEANRLKLAADRPPNVTFTGFLPEADFVQLLATSAVIVDLTLLADCLVCGAYEGTVLGTPLVLSDTPANRSTFALGAVFCRNEAADIAAAITRALADNAELRAQMTESRARLTEIFDRQFERFRELIGLETVR
jgi:glycosyltransferase involved in cell wall biosynthesis